MGALQSSQQPSGSHSPLPDDLPSEDTLIAQLRILVDRLRAAVTEASFRSRWANARDTVIAQDILTRQRFYEGIDEYLYLLQHCAAKSQCEAVLEGMGSQWDRSAEGGRHPTFTVSQQEAMISYNAPPAYLPEAKPFVRRALDHHFGVKDPAERPEKWNFTHRDARQRQIQFTAGSKTLQKLQETPTRLPAALYDVPALQ